MTYTFSELENLGAEERARLIVDFFHRTMIHHALWYDEVKHQMGQKRALKMLHSVSAKSAAVQLSHLGELLGFETKNGIPQPLITMDEEKQRQLLSRAAKNWR